MDREVAGERFGLLVVFESLMAIPPFLIGGAGGTDQVAGLLNGLAVGEAEEGILLAAFAGPELGLSRFELEWFPVGGHFGFASEKKWKIRATRHPTPKRLYGWGGVESKIILWKWLIAEEIEFGNFCDRLSSGIDLAVIFAVRTLGGRAIRLNRHSTGVAAAESHRYYDFGKRGGCSKVSLREAAFPRPYDRGFREESPAGLLQCCAYLGMC